MNMRHEIVKFAVVGGGALALAAGCTLIPAVGPDYHEPNFETPVGLLPDAGMPTTNLTATGEYRPAASNDDLRVVISEERLAQWWRNFNDDVLESLVSGAVSNNLSFHMAIERLAQAEWRLLGSYSAFLPKVGVDGAWTRSEAHRNNSTMVGTGHRHRESDLYHAGFNGTWEIDIFGGSRRATEAAMAEAEAAGWSVADAWIELTTRIGRDYVSLRTTQDRLAVARTNLVLQSETYDILKSRLDSGIGDELAVNQSKYIVDQTRARIPTLLADEEALKNALAILAGETPGELHGALVAVEPRRDWLLEPQKLGELPLNLIRARPDVRVAERKLAAQVAAVGVAESMWFPKLFINGSLGMESMTVSKFLQPGSFYASIGPSVSWPIFQGGNIYANIKVEEAKTEEARLNYMLTLDTAYAEVRDAYSAYTQEYHRYQALAGAVKAAQDAVTISNDLYKNGLRDFTAVIDAQRSLLNLEEELVVSRGEITLGVIELYRALGGGLAAD